MIDCTPLYSFKKRTPPSAPRLSVDLRYSEIHVSAPNQNVVEERSFSETPEYFVVYNRKASSSSTMLSADAF